MRVNEFREPHDDLFEDADVDAVINIATDGDAAFSKPMSAEDAIALTLGKSPEQ